MVWNVEDIIASLEDGEEIRRKRQKSAKGKAASLPVVEQTVSNNYCGHGLNERCSD